LKGDGRGVESATSIPAAPPVAGSQAATGNVVTVDFCEDWPGLVAAIARGEVDGGRPLSKPVAELWAGERAEHLLLRVAVNGQSGGFIVAHRRAEGVFEVVPVLGARAKANAADALLAARLALRRLFIEGPAHCLFFIAAEGAADARQMALEAGFCPAGRRAGFAFFRLDWLVWFTGASGSFRADGLAFRRLAFPDGVAEDPMQDAVLGAFLAMLRTQPAKGFAFVDAACLLFGLPGLEPLLTTPELVLWQHGGAVVAVHRGTGNLTLLHRA